MSDGADPGAQRRTGWAVALLFVGFVVAFLPGLVMGERFVHAFDMRGYFPEFGPSTPGWVEVAGPDEDGAHFSVHTIHCTTIQPITLAPIYGTSATALARTDLGWAVAAASLAIAPLLFAWWRFGGPSFGRPAGVVCAVLAGVSVCVFVARMTDTSRLFPAGVWWTVPVGGALMAAAFLVAPTPRRRDE